jgi:hypothetical protein
LLYLLTAHWHTVGSKSPNSDRGRRDGRSLSPSAGRRSQPQTVRAAAVGALTRICVRYRIVQILFPLLHPPVRSRPPAMMAVDRLNGVRALRTFRLSTVGAWAQGLEHVPIHCSKSFLLSGSQDSIAEGGSSHCPFDKERPARCTRPKSAFGPSVGSPRTTATSLSAGRSVMQRLHSHP